MSQVIRGALNKPYELPRNLTDRSDGTLGEVNATTTAGEADEYGNYLSDTPRKPGFKVVNTGTIDPFRSLWGVERMTHAKKRFLTPYLDARRVSKNRRTLYESPKVLFAKLAKSCEAFLDDNGAYASLNTNCFHSPKDGVSLDYVLAFCNSSVFMFLYEQFFGALRMNGGYFQFQAPQLRIIPVREAPPAGQKAIVSLARRIAGLDESDGQDELDRLRSNLDELFFALYGLQEDEINRVKKRGSVGVSAPEDEGDG
jgi:hypothetical protein